MVHPRPDRSRLGDLLVEMRLIEPETLSSALAEGRSSGRRLPRVLSERRVLDEERLTKAVAAKLGLEAVTVSNLKIHERVLQLIPAEVAQRYGVLPIAIKRTNQAELLYLVMVDPLDTEAIGEVQRITGRQVRVLMATSSDLDLAITNQYRRLASAPPAQAPAANKSGQVPAVPKAPQPAQGSVRPPPLRRSDEVSVRAPVPQRTEPSPIRTGGTARSDGPPVVRGLPAAQPAGTSERARAAAESSRPRYPAMEQATLIDSARPPELDALSLPPLPATPLPSHPEDAPVMPSDLDPPDSVSTRIDPGPFGKIEASDAAQSPVSDIDRQWDLAVKAFSEMSEAENPLASPAGSDESSASKRDPVTTEASLDHLALLSESEPDDDEDLKTSQLELGEMGAAEFQRQMRISDARDSAPPRAKPKRSFAGTLEVPVEFADEHHPFDGPSLEEIPIGLDRTGIIPAIDWDREEFVPPPPPKSQSSSFVGASDIPVSPAEVQARFKELQDAPKAAPEEDVIEAIEEVSLDPIDSEVIKFEPPTEAPRAEAKAPSSPPASASNGVGASNTLNGSGAASAPNTPHAQNAPTDPPRPAQLEAPPTLPRTPRPLEARPEEKAPADARMTPSADSDADRVPVIEPSSLVSLMDDGVEHATDDTGAELAPFGSWQDSGSAPATRLFDESNRQVVQAPEPAPKPPQEEDEPTNPRIDTSSVQAMLRDDEATLGVGADALPSPYDEETYIPPPRGETTVDDRDEPLIEEVAAEEPTPSEDTVDRNSVLLALDGQFWEPAPPPPEADPEPTPEEQPVVEAIEAPSTTPASEESLHLVDELLANDALSSAERAQLVLAIGRLLVKKGLVSREELAAALDS